MNLVILLSYRVGVPGALAHFRRETGPSGSSSSPSEESNVSPATAVSATGSIVPPSFSYMASLPQRKKYADHLKAARSALKLDILLAYAEKLAKTEAEPEATASLSASGRGKRKVSDELPPRRTNVKMAIKNPNRRLYKITVSTFFLFLFCGRLCAFPDRVRNETGMIPSCHFVDLLRPSPCCVFFSLLTYLRHAVFSSLLSDNLDMFCCCGRTSLVPVLRHAVFLLS
jgi:hypothetical protein